MKKADRQSDETPDPLSHIVPDLLHLAQASAWSGAHIHNRELSASSNVEACPDLTVLTTEYRLQRAVSPSGRRIAATLRPVAGFTNGICMIFTDGNEDCAILTLMRKESLPPFSSIEISLLTFALAAESDRVTALRLQPSSQRKSGYAEFDIGPISRSPHQEAFYVLDDDMEIILSWQSEHRIQTPPLSGAPPIVERLPPILERSVRNLTARWTLDSVKEPGIARPVAFLVLRTHPMVGRAGQFVGVRIDRFLPPNSLTGIAARFHFTPREIQVLAKLLDGTHLDLIARDLIISPSTVQDHVRSMIDKSESRNRSEMIARILGWESAPNPRQSL